MRFPKPWYRKNRGWFVTLGGKQIRLGTDRDEALLQYQVLMAKPQQRSIPNGALLSLIEVFLDWCEKHRAPDTYEWYRSRLERFAQAFPQLRTGELRPYHVQQWLDVMNVSNGAKHNYGRAIKRCLRWAKQLAYVDGARQHDVLPLATILGGGSPFPK